jgi:hypothetical protein
MDVQEERRNFPGYAKANVFSLDDIQKGDTYGTTDTDVKTHDNYKEGETGYTNIYSAYADLDRSGGGEVLPIEALGTRRI